MNALKFRFYLEINQLKGSCHSNKQYFFSIENWRSVNVSANPSYSEKTCIQAYLKESNFGTHKNYV